LLIVNVPPTSSSGEKLIDFCALAKIDNGRFEVRETHSLRVAQDRHHQSFAAPNGHTDVVIITIDNVGAAQFRIDLRMKFQALDAGA
jgi:hypothetical protein